MRHAIAKQLSATLSLVAATVAGCAGGLEDREVFEQLFADSGIPGGEGGGTGGSSDAATGDGTGGEPAADSGQPSDDYSDVPQEVFQEFCTLGCHDDNAQGGLDLLSPGYADRLLGTVSDTAECGGEVLVDASDPEESLLYRKLLDDPPCGDRMPLVGVALDEEEIGSVLAWIAGGMPEPDDDEPEPDDDEPDGGDDEPGAGDLLDSDDWTVTADPLPSDSSDGPENAIDGDAGSRYTTGAAMQGGEWLQIDFGDEASFSEVEVDSSGSPGDYFRSFALYATDDPDDRGAPFETGAGDDSGVTTISFDTQTARYLIIEQTGTDAESWWSVHELTVRR